MLSKSNKVFTALKKAENAWYKEKKQHDKQFDDLIKKYGYFTPETNEWSIENTRIRHSYPLTLGEKAALTAWAMSVSYKEKHLEVLNDLIPEEAEDFFKTLEAAKVKQFIFTGEDEIAMSEFAEKYGYEARLDHTCFATRHISGYDMNGYAIEVEGFWFVAKRN